MDAMTNVPDRCNIELMHLWLRSTAARVSRPVLWMMCGFLLALFALAGLGAIAPLNYQPPQALFFAGIFLLTLFWIGWVVFFTSLNCWINSKNFP